MILITHPESDGDQDQMVMAWLEKTRLNVMVETNDGSLFEGHIVTLQWGQVKVVSMSNAEYLLNIAQVKEVRIT